MLTNVKWYISFMAIFYDRKRLYKCKGNLKKKKTGKSNIVKE